MGRGALLCALAWVAACVPTVQALPLSRAITGDADIPATKFHSRAATRDKAAPGRCRALAAGCNTTQRALILVVCTLFFSLTRYTASWKMSVMTACRPWRQRATWT